MTEVLRGERSRDLGKKNYKIGTMHFMIRPLQLHAGFVSQVRLTHFLRFFY
jgi:hypothetical protein